MKIFLCTTAPSKNYKSWSNIPYLLHKNLEKNGYVVENYVMKEVEPLRSIFNLPIRILNKYFEFNTTYFYVRTPVHFFFTHLYSLFIGLISDKQDVMVVQGFSYPPHNHKNRQIIIGDWPSEYLFEKFLKRRPSHLEKRSIDRENSVIENADAIITLFPNVRDYMLRKYKNQNIYYFGNVINIDNDVKIPLDIRVRKINSKRFLFIGQAFYLSGALELITASRNLRDRGINCEVDIVGINPNLIEYEYDWLRVYGYLDKEKPDDKLKYYELLANARIMVNTTPGWSGFQALLEALYFYNPIVVRANESLSSYFLNLTSFAHILNDNGHNLESILLQSLCNNSNYQQMSDEAHKSVKHYSWTNFTNHLINLFK